MEEEIAKWEKKDPQGIRNSMAKPGENLVLVKQSMKMYGEEKRQGL